MDGKKIVFMLILYINTLSNAQYEDDADYEDYNVYEESMPRGSMHRVETERFYKDVKPGQDDFYVVSDNDENEPVGDASVVRKDKEFISNADDNGVESFKQSYEQLKSLQAPEITYRYTKHRIPGYDYEELEWAHGKKHDNCDRRSVWSHCVCQFTCKNPHEVDCYMPCMSGCECKADFVLDEITGRCIPPETCPIKHETNVSNK